MKKKTMILLALLTWMGGSGLWAQTEAPCVVVEQTDGTRTEYVLSAEPRISYAADVVTLTTADATLQLPVADVKKVYLASSVTTAVGTQRQPSAPRIELTADGLRLSGLTAGTTVSVYAADGRQLLAPVAATDGTLSISLGRQPQGMLIIKTNNQSFKLIRK